MVMPTLPMCLPRRQHQAMLPAITGRPHSSITSPAKLATAKTVRIEPESGAERKRNEILKHSAKVALMAIVAAIVAVAEAEGMDEDEVDMGVATGLEAAVVSEVAVLRNPLEFQHIPKTSAFWFAKPSGD